MINEIKAFENKFFKKAKSKTRKSIKKLVFRERAKLKASPKKSRAKLILVDIRL